jgi:hypothetical protein
MFATSPYCENLLVGFFVISAADKRFFFGGFLLTDLEMGTVLLDLCKLLLLQQSQY